MSHSGDSRNPSTQGAGVLTVAQRPDTHVPIVIIGAGACGLVAALAARDGGAEVLVLERDSIPRGSTAMSSGLIPSAATRWQADLKVSDSPALMAADIQNKNHDEADVSIVQHVTQNSASTLHWLADHHGVEFSLVTGFLYPGHSVMRMHGTPRRTGDELMGSLTNATERAGVDILCDALVTHILATSDNIICGVRIIRPDGSFEDIGCDALILACSGFGANTALVQQNMPAMSNAVYHGHAGNQGDALGWGAALGAQMQDLGSYQGHGSVAWPHQTLISWSVMMMGGIQVNRLGYRFSNEHEGYSEQARRVLAQPDGLAWNVFDQRIHDAAMAFEDYRQAWSSNAIHKSDTLEDLAHLMDVSTDALTQTVHETWALCEQGKSDSRGRTFKREETLVAPFYAVQVTGALFHTQGGLVIDTHARVLHTEGPPIPNLYAGGGAARGVSGSNDTGYLSGNGLLAAVMLGATAGKSAAQQVLQASST